MPTPPACPVVPEAWTEPTTVDAPLPTTIEDLRLYTLDVQSRLASCNADKAEIRRRLAE